MAKQSAGILLFRLKQKAIDVLLVHPGGPFWKKKDEGAWTIPKGEPARDEELQTTAVREFQEETGIALTGPYLALTPVIQKGGKTVHAWACNQDIDADSIRSNRFEMEWPPRSGKKQSFPEIDRAEWFSIPAAMLKINEAQRNLLQELEQKLGSE